MFCIPGVWCWCMSRYNACVQIQIKSIDRIAHLQRAIHYCIVATRIHSLPLESCATMSFPNPLNLPDDVLPVVHQFITTEYASLTKDGTPITFPLTPYVSDDGYTLDVSTGLSYTSKAERARRNPKVCLLYSNPVGSHIDHAPTVLVYGMASIRDRDLQANTDRYVRLALGRFPQAYKSTPRFLLRSMVWYFARIWIQVTPLRMLWWANGNTDAAPQEWRAPQGTQAPPSDPAPSGQGLGSWKEAPLEWQSGAQQAVSKMGLPVLTVVDGDGFPVPFRVSTVSVEANGFSLTLPAGMPALAQGRACLTFHHHKEEFTGQENMLFVGTVSHDGATAKFVVEKRMADWSLGHRPLQIMWNMIRNQGKLKPRLQQEAARRNQPVPKVNLPEGY